MVALVVVRLGDVAVAHHGRDLLPRVSRRRDLDVVRIGAGPDVDGSALSDVVAPEAFLAVVEVSTGIALVLLLREVVTDLRAVVLVEGHAAQVRLHDHVVEVDLAQTHGRDAEDHVVALLVVRASDVAVAHRGRDLLPRVSGRRDLDVVRIRALPDVDGSALSDVVAPEAFLAVVEVSTGIALVLLLREVVTDLRAVVLVEGHAAQVRLHDHVVEVDLAQTHGRDAEDHVVALLVVRAGDVAVAHHGRDLLPRVSRRRDLDVVRIGAGPNVDGSALPDVVAPEAFLAVVEVAARVALEFLRGEVVTDLRAVFLVEGHAAQVRLHDRVVERHLATA